MKVRASDQKWQSGALTPTIRWLLYAGNKVAPLRRQFSGAMTPKVKWLLCADNSHDMMSAVDKADAAQFSRDEILNPSGWVLLNYLMDSRTGLGRFRDFRIANYELMTDLIYYCRNHSLEQIMQLPDVKERTDLYFEHAEKFKAQLKSCSTVYKNLIVTDLRSEETIFAGNRFMVYAMFPETNISVHVHWGLKNQNTIFATGKSILNRTSKTKIGELMLQYGGGGHDNAGTCQITNDKADAVLKELITKISVDG